MRPDGLTILAGGRVEDEQIAAVAAAISCVLDEERSALAVDPIPAVYRSAWRRAGIRDALDAGTVR